MATANDCTKIVNRNYLVGFIDSIELSDKNGNKRSIPTASNYCPTYSELKEIGMFSPNTSPSKDDDGLILGNAYAQSQTYAENQLVCQGDLSIGYTRYSSFTISPSSDEVPTSGGNVTFSSDVYFKRWAKSMNVSCVPNTSNETVKDSYITVEYSSSVGTFRGNILTVGENTTSEGREIEVTANISFRGENISSNTVTLTQGNSCGCGKVTISLL